MREFRPYGSVRGARSNARPYRDSPAMTAGVVIQPKSTLIPAPMGRRPLSAGPASHVARERDEANPTSKPPARSPCAEPRFADLRLVSFWAENEAEMRCFGPERRKWVSRRLA